MRVAILTPTFSAFSGIDRVVEEEAERFAKKGNKVAIFCLRAEMKTDCAELVVLGMPKKPFFERVYRLLFFIDFPKIIKYTKQLKNYDQIICHFYPMTILACNAKKKYGVKYVYHNAGIAYPRLFRGIERIYLNLFSILTNLTIKNCDEAISISQFLQKQLKKETGIDSVVEYVKIDKKRFNKNIDKTKLKKLKEKYSLNGPVFLYVGRLSPHKGIHLLIKSFKIVNQKIPNAKLLVVGKPTFDGYFKKLKELANDNIIFAGFVSDEELPYYYGACSAYTTATLWEGFDMPAAEAQACGKPVVAFDIGAHPEVVKSGKLVKTGDAEAFAQAMVSAVS